MNELSDNEVHYQGDLFGGKARRAKTLSDDELLRLVFEVLEEIVPHDGGEAKSGLSHREAVLNSVKRFFQRSGDKFYYTFII